MVCWGSVPSGRACTGSSRRNTTRSWKAQGSTCRSRRSWRSIRPRSLPTRPPGCSQPTSPRSSRTDSIDIVVELIGGTDAAFDFLDAALRKGKNVVTANKQLLASRGESLFNLARDEKRHLRFEASVAGAIPIIKVMRESMIAAGLHTVYGIVNGTTNYILTRMYNDEGDYAEILAKAQELGYAEADPTADVGGADAAAKMAILGSIAFHSRVTLADVAYEGIQDVSSGRRPLCQGPRLRGQAHRRRPADRRSGERAGVPGSGAGRSSAGVHQRLAQRGVPPGRRHRRDHADGSGRRRPADGHGGRERHRVHRQHQGRGLPAELLLLPQSGLLPGGGGGVGLLHQDERGGRLPACWRRSPPCSASTVSRSPA